MRRFFDSLSFLPLYFLVGGTLSILFPKYLQVKERSVLSRHSSRSFINFFTIIALPVSDFRLPHAQFNSLFPEVLPGRVAKYRSYKECEASSRLDSCLSHDYFLFGTQKVDLCGPPPGSPSKIVIVQISSFWKLMELFLSLFQLKAGEACTHISQTLKSRYLTFCASHPPFLFSRGPPPPLFPLF